MRARDEKKKKEEIWKLIKYETDCRISVYVMCMCVCCTEDKKGGVDRSSTVIAKEPEGKLAHTGGRENTRHARFSTSTRRSVCDTCVTTVYVSVPPLLSVNVYKHYTCIYMCVFYV